MSFRTSLAGAGSSSRLMERDERAPQSRSAGTRGVIHILSPAASSVHFLHSLQSLWDVAARRDKSIACCTAGCQTFAMANQRRVQMVQKQLLRELSTMLLTDKVRRTSFSEFSIANSAPGNSIVLSRRCACEMDSRWTAFLHVDVVQKRPTRATLPCSKLEQGSADTTATRHSISMRDVMRRMRHICLWLAVTDHAASPVFPLAARSQRRPPSGAPGRGRNSQHPHLGHRRAHVGGPAGGEDLHLRLWCVRPFSGRLSFFPARRPAAAPAVRALSALPLRRPSARRPERPRRGGCDGRPAAGRGVHPQPGAPAPLKLPTRLRRPRSGALGDP